MYSGNFDVGPNGAPKLLDCVAYKLCYYKFGQMQTEYNKPPGYDRARGKEVGLCIWIYGYICMHICMYI
jgi:dolichyl-diphosphooligosaccharide--protein glycosyltransferase